MLGGRESSKDGKVTFGTAKAFACHEAQAMQVVAVPDSRLVQEREHETKPCPVASPYLALFIGPIRHTLLMCPRAAYK